MGPPPRPASVVAEEAREAGRPGRLAEVAALFLKLGFTAFGGPAAHIAMMRREVVDRLRWVSERRFVDLLGVTHLIPGPNSTEMAIHLGYVRAGWPGLVVAGVCFIVPAALTVLALSWAYVRYGATPQAAWLLYGIKPVIVAVVVHALWGLGRTALKDALALAVALAVLAAYLAGGHEIALLFGGAVTYALARAIRTGRRATPAAPAVLPVSTGMTPSGNGPSGWAMAGSDGGTGAASTALGAAATGGTLAAAAAGAAVPFSLSTLFLVFLKIGAVLYGSGYVLLAFLRKDFVERLGWLTDRQLLDAVAVGQFTPGPVFTTATFVGYVTGGLAGAALATLGIFLPSFLFVAAVRTLADSLRRSSWTAVLLDGVNAAAVALMAGVTLELAREALVDGLTGLLGIGALWALIRLQVNSTWLILAGALAGAAAGLLPGLGPGGRPGGG